jgi:hypothetical protein
VQQFVHNRLKAGAATQLVINQDSASTVAELSTDADAAADFV